MTSAKAEIEFIRTPRARLNYANVLAAKVSRFDSTKKNFNCVLVFDPGTDLSQLKMLVWKAATTAWGENKARDPAVVWPFKELTPEHPSMPGFPKGSVAINLQSQFAPLIGNQSNRPIESPDEIYSGCYVWVKVNAWAWEKAGRRGVSFGLGNMQKLADGPRLDNRRSLEDDFEPLPGADDAPGNKGGGGSSGSSGN